MKLTIYTVIIYGACTSSCISSCSCMYYTCLLIDPYIFSNVIYFVSIICLTIMIQIFIRVFICIAKVVCCTRQVPSVIFTYIKISCWLWSCISYVYITQCIFQIKLIFTKCISSLLLWSVCCISTYVYCQHTRYCYYQS